MNISKLKAKFHQYFPSVQGHGQIDTSFLSVKSHSAYTGHFSVSPSVIPNPPKITLGRMK